MLQSDHPYNDDEWSRPGLVTDGRGRTNTMQAGCGLQNKGQDGGGQEGWLARHETRT